MIRLPSCLSLLAITACTSLATPSPVAGTEWRVSAINGRATPAGPASYRMSFKGNQVGGQFGCNHFGGNYALRGDVMTTGAMMMTEMACMGPSALFEAEGIKVLQQPMKLGWQGPASLTLSNAAGSITLTR